MMNAADIFDINLPDYNAVGINEDKSIDQAQDNLTGIKEVVL